MITKERIIEVIGEYLRYAPQDQTKWDDPLGTMADTILAEIKPDWEWEGRYNEGMVCPLHCQEFMNKFDGGKILISIKEIK